MALTPVQEAQVLDLIAQQSALLSLAGVEATILSKLGATKVTLSDLPTASVIDDADLLLLRQGVTDKSVTGLTFKNLIPSTITTPPQFDNDTSIANTAFVQRALGNFSNGGAYTSAVTLTALQAGRALIFGGASPYTVTLPLLSEVPDGAAYYLTSHTNLASVTIQRQGADAINMASETVATFILNNGDSAILTKASGSWRLISGSAQLPYSSIFGASLATNGYQKLPSGLIIQWGTASLTSGGGTTVTYPIAYPNSAVSTVATYVNSAATSAIFASISNLVSDKTSFVIAGFNLAGARINGDARWVSIGY